MSFYLSQLEHDLMYIAPKRENNKFLIFDF